MSTPTRILIVDDDPEITSALARGLALHGYDTVTEHRVDSAMKLLREDPFGAAIIDVMIGADSGIDLVRALRGEGIGLPIVMLSALSEVDDRARGLEAGADDYIVKPFSFDELVARLKVQERRAHSEKPRRARLDPATRKVICSTREVVLTEREFGLLQLLARHAGEAQSRGRIFDALWAGEGTSSENVVDVYLGYLRRKLDPSADFGFEIKTLRNRGFMLDGTAPDLD
ncbi:response regulator transcription factor [Puniceibacterium sediminis]|uniref:DNA-binding response regulator, OmpR family, contains REC and winged-helix (WHTH) domain n=1 Tax=Puniceibacterium sediminis TaxID=1608407 RepID=A0A238YCR8_9RHOB|nr:response regulator transcription factor [Puniceibacterium sediminis]SNR69056.1 DNA-binding response regulator, OmpR family, contains REC and winged-helix (wHTH) domain [Puniceibacterium sediminis]